MDMNVLEISGVTYAYDDVHGKAERKVLRDISFSVAQGESVGLIGANGVGKSTLLKLICGLLPLQQGQMLVAGLPVCKANLKAVRRLMGYVFQDSESQLFMPTIYEDVAFGPRNYGYTKEQVDDAVRTALRQVHLEDRCHQPIYQLSGGEKKLASIATVLAMQSQLMLLDEPSVALDPRHRRELIHLLGNLVCAKLIASHDLDFIYDTCQRVVLLGEGNKVCEGPTAQVLQDQALLEQHGLELPLSFSRRIRGGNMGVAP